MKKLIRNGKSVKATISYRDGSYRIERAVFIDEDFNQFVRVNGSFVDLDFYRTNPEFKFHGYWD